MKTARWVVVMGALVSAGWGGTLLEAQAWPTLTVAPRFVQLREARSTSYLSMTCEPTGPGNFMSLLCQFDQTLITRPTAEQAERSLTRAGERLSERTDAAVAEELRGVCRDEPTAAACSCLRPRFDRACLERSMVSFEEREAQRCSLIQNTFSLEVRRTGPYRWTGTIQGNPVLFENCSVTTLIVLEGVPPERGGPDAYLWTFRQSRAVVGSDDCREAFQSDSDYSWQHRPSNLQCNGFQ